MGVLKTAGNGAAALVLGGVSFLVGLFGWAAISGVIDGLLAAQAGTTMPMVVRLAGGPVLGLIAAGYVVQEVSSS